MFSRNTETKFGTLVDDHILRVKISIPRPIITIQVIVITATAGGPAGFTLSWFSAGASLVGPPVLISILLIRSLLIRSVAQQIVNQRDYSKFKKLVNQILEDD